MKPKKFPPLFLFLFSLIPLQSWGAGVPLFVYEGHGISETGRKITYFLNGPEVTIYKGVSDELPIQRALFREVDQKITIHDGVFPTGPVRIHLRRFGPWMYIVRGPDFEQSKVVYSIFTEGIRQWVFRGYLTTPQNSGAAYSLVRDKSRVFIVRGHAPQANEVRFTLSETLDRDFIHNNYQTGSGEVLWTLEKGIGQNFIHAGFSVDPSTTRLSLIPYLNSAPAALSYVFTMAGTYFNRDYSIGFLLATQPAFELRRETLMVLCILENESTGSD